MELKFSWVREISGAGMVGRLRKKGMGKGGTETN